MRISILPLLRTSGRRLAVAAAGLAGVFAYVGDGLVRAQLHPDTELVVTPQEYTLGLKAYRGGIYDRNGIDHPLAQTVPAWKVAVDPVAIPDDDARGAAYRALARHRLCDGETLYRAVTARRGRYHVLATTTDAAVAADVATNAALRNRVRTDKVSRRSYPLGRELCHVVGVVNSHEEPLCGLEKTLDGELRGTDGRIVGEADRNRRELRSRRREEVAAVDGRDVILTIDERLQFAVDQALDRAMEKWRPRAAWAIVQDPETGELLAMASRPDFDPARFSESTTDQQFNRCLSTVYEPGSVMKTFAAAAALDEGLVATNTMLDVRPGLYCGRLLSDHTHGQSELTVAQMLAWSSNRGASRLGMLLGKERQQRHLKAFGFGRPTGLPLRGEGAGQTIGDGSELNNIRISMGQGMTVTAIQLITAYSAIANGGRLMKPFLVKEVRERDGTVVSRTEPTVVGHPVTARTAAQLREILRSVATRGGTARRAAVRGFSVAGKTGTAQMVENGRYSQTDHRGTFVGFFPVEAPRFTILVTLEAVPPTEEERHAYHGGVSAAPVFAEIAEAAALLYGLEPDGGA